MTQTLEDLAYEDRVYVGESMYPVDIVDDHGVIHKKVKVWVVQTSHLEDTDWVMVVVNERLETVFITAVKPVDFSTAVRVYESEAGQINYYKNGGCGCGSRLRSWNPWAKNVRLVAVPNPRTTVVA